MILILIFTILVIFLLYEFYLKRRNLPPGPLPLPLIGNLLELANPKPGYEAFRRWEKEYGSVFTFWMATKPFVVITSFDIMKETFLKDGETYSDKLLAGHSPDESGNNFGILDTNGAMWREHRRFALSQLRNLGLGKDLMQEKILLEIGELHSYLDAHLGENVDLPQLLDRSVANIINLTLFNKRFETKDRDEFLYLKSLIDGMMDTVAQFRYYIQHLIPWTSKIIPGPKLHQKTRKYRTLLDEFFKKQIEEHRKEINLDCVESSDYVEAYLKEQKKRENGGDNATFCNQQLMAVCFDLYMAGLMTTTMTLTWGISYFLHHPEVQNKIQKELEEVIGSTQLITIANKNDLPYLSAFLNETQRCANIIPLNLLHVTTRDTVIDGHDIQKGTGVIAQISNLMFDEKIFPDPHRFNPDRFIENGKLKKVDELIPFSIGKRQCLGEGLARMELFLFFANLFNRYKFQLGKGGLPSLDKSNDNFVMPRKFNVVLEKCNK